MTFPNHSELIQIRRMLSKDVSEVTAIDRLSFSLPWSENAFYYELNENLNSAQWVAEATDQNRGQHIVGVIVVWLIVDEAHISTLAVHPDYRRRGIARQLMITGLAEGVRRGARLATLEVRAGNVAAQILYRDFKFEVVGRRPRYYVDNGEDALIMSAWPINQGYINDLVNSKSKPVSMKEVS